LALYLGGNTLFNHVNALDSASMRTLQSGAEAEDILFYPWGDVWEVQGSGGYNFANIPYRDVTTTTDITTARFSSPNLGRWFTPDPAGKGAVRLDDPQTWNMYAYVRNNPTTLTDPSGLLMLPLMSWAGPSGVPPGCGFPCVDVGYEEENGGEPPPPNPPASEKPPEQKDTQHVIVPDPQSERTGSYMGKAFKEQEVIYQTFKVDDKGSPTSTDKKTDFELREKIVAGSKDVWTCGTAGSCRSEGGAFGDQQRVFKGESYDVEKRFTIDGKSAQVYDPGTKKSYDYVVVHSTYEGGFQFKFLNDPR
jgi:RHS repeat-associated protein